MWNDLVSWEDLPKLENPEGGYLRNENDPFHFTNLNQILHPDDFPDNFPKPQLRLRSQYSLSLIDNGKQFSLADVVALKHRMGMYLTERVKPDLIAAVRNNELKAETAQAIQHIADWDNTAAKDSRGGLLFETCWGLYADLLDPNNRIDPTPESAGFSATAEDLFVEPWSPDQPTETPKGLANFELAAEAFEWAVADTKNRYGEWDISWGNVHRARIGDNDFAVGGCAGLLGCSRVLSFDQLELFANNEMKRMVFSDEDIHRQLKREYHPGQEKIN